MLPEKYRPRSAPELLGNKMQMHELCQWLRAPRGCIVCYGPPGIGKTTAARLAAEEAGYEVVEHSSGDDYRDVLLVAGQRGISGKRKLILAEGEAGAAKLVAASQAPVIVVSDSYPKLPSRKIRFYRVRSDILEAFLRRVCTAEQIRYDDSGIAQLARQSAGDVRAALLDIEAAGAATLDAVKQLGERSNERSIFDTLGAMLGAPSLEAALSAVRSSEKPPEEIFAWLCENAEGAEALDALSRADIVRSRIARRQSWSLQKQFIALIAVAACASKRKARFSPPQRMRRSDDNARFAQMLHVSQRRVREYDALIEMLGSRKLREA